MTTNRLQLDMTEAELDHYAAMEREFFGDPEKETGIYHPDVVEDCLCVDEYSPKLSEALQREDFGFLDKEKYPECHVELYPSSPAPFYARIGRSSPP